MLVVGHFLEDSMNFDQQLVRDHSAPGFNLAVGEPFFLRDALFGGGDSFHLAPASAVDAYPQLGGEKYLMAELKHRHPKQHVVIACGATQAIQAATAALRSSFVERYGDPLPGEVLALRHEAPYWPRYPTMAERSNMKFGTGIVSHKNPVSPWVVNVCTSPNNPDGDISADTKQTYDIWDAAYAHPVYGFTPDSDEPRHRVSVWSAAKLLGVSGLRVGWLVTGDAAIAREAADFVEQTTSGVSTVSQWSVANTLRSMREHPRDTRQRYARARQTLMKNGEVFLSNLMGHCAAIHGVPNSMRGMFAWFKVREPVRFERALQKAKVALVTGEACGMTEAGWYRMSCGHRNDFTERALTALQQALSS